MLEHETHSPQSTFDSGAGKNPRTKPERSQSESSVVGRSAVGSHSSLLTCSENSRSKQQHREAEKGRHPALKGAKKQHEGCARNKRPLQHASSCGRTSKRCGSSSQFWASKPLRKPSKKKCCWCLQTDHPHHVKKKSGCPPWTQRSGGFCRGVHKPSRKILILVVGAKGCHV